MRTMKYSFHILLFVLNFPYILTLISAQSNQSTSASPDRFRVDVAEGGVLPQNTTLSKTSPHDINVPLVNHSIPMQINNSNAIKDIRKPLQNPNDTKQIEEPPTSGKAKINSNDLFVNVSPIPIPNTTKTAQIIKHIPTKPRITEHDDPDQIEIQSQAYVPEIPAVDALKKKNKRADYIIPIVAVIFSIPLVAIIISVVYKRGADWWQHRNYRRMDFLIEGMYNS